MPAALILRLARTSRCAIVASGTRNARAISSVVRPPSVRSVSATCASVASAGWQQVKTSSSRSSLKVGSSSMSSSAVAGASSSCAFSASVRSRRMRSIALLRAVAISHARGFAGAPSRGQRSAAVANASWAASSASSKSPRRPTRVASTRPHSSRKARSISALVLHERADLDGSAQACRRDPSRQLDRGVEVVGLVDVVAAELLLRLGERAVGGERAPVLDAYGRGRRGRLELVAVDHAGGVVDRHVLLVDGLLLVLGELRPGALVAGSLDQQDVLHRFLLRSGVCAKTNGGHRNRQGGGGWPASQGVRPRTPRPTPASSARFGGMFSTPSGVKAKTWGAADAAVAAFSTGRGGKSEQIAAEPCHALGVQPDQPQAAVVAAADDFAEGAEPAVAAARPARHEPLRHEPEDQDGGDRGAAEGGPHRAPAGRALERPEGPRHG